jgi:hypothetical protein
MGCGWPTKNEKCGVLDVCVKECVLWAGRAGQAIGGLKSKVGMIRDNHTALSVTISSTPHFSFLVGQPQPFDFRASIVELSPQPRHLRPQRA